MRPHFGEVWAVDVVVVFLNEEYLAMLLKEELRSRMGGYMYIVEILVNDQDDDEMRRGSLGW
jgi:hypothetical protein